MELLALREIRGFFFQNKRLPVIRCTKKLREVTKLRRSRLDQRKTNCIGFSMKHQIDGSLLSVNSFVGVGIYFPVSKNW